MDKYPKTLAILKWTYKTLRSIIFSVVILIAVVFVAIYAALAVPPVQEYIRGVAQTELRNFLGCDVEISELTIRPVNEVIVKEARFSDLEGKQCLEVGRLGAGINLWRLIFGGRIEITYVELLDFKADIYQSREGEPLNIDFIIRAFAPKEKNRPPTKFDLMIHNIVIRRGEAKFDRLWKERKEKGFDPDHISLSGLSGDITIPRLSNEDIEIDLRRLSFTEKSGLQVKEIGGYFTVADGALAVRNFILRLPETVLKTRPFDLPLAYLSNKNEGIPLEQVAVRIEDSRITPSNLDCFFPPLANFDTSLPLEVTLTVDENDLNIKGFRLGTAGEIQLQLDACIHGYRDKTNTTATIEGLMLTVSSQSLTGVLEKLQSVKDNSKLNLEELGSVQFSAKGVYASARKTLDAEMELTSAAGNLSARGNAIINEKKITGDISLDIPSFNMATLLPDIPVENLMNARFVADASLDLEDVKASEGRLEFSIEEIDLLKRTVTNIEGSGSKDGEIYTVAIDVNDINLDGTLNATLDWKGEDSEWDLVAHVNDFDTYNSFLAESADCGYEIEGTVEANAIGNTIDNLTGSLRLSNFHVRKWNGRELYAKSLTLGIDDDELYGRKISLESDFADFDMEGDYRLSKIPGMLRRTLWEVCPAVFQAYEADADCGSGRFKLTVKDAQPMIDFFGLPIFPLTEMGVTGSFDSMEDRIELTTDIPFIQQGDNKLITGTYLKTDIIGSRGEASILAGTVYPTKKGLLKMDLDIAGKNGSYDIGVEFNRGRNVSFHGDIGVKVELDKDPYTGNLMVDAVWEPSRLFLNATEWKVEPSEIIYSDGFLSVDDFCIRHDDQYVIITGTNNRVGEGVLKVVLSEIDMDYIFDTLNINHVNFGGRATGEVIAQDIFSKTPDIHTNNLFAKDFRYNDSWMGDAQLRASLDLPAKKINIGATIDDGVRTVADVDGGVWFGRDSLSFKFKADRVNVGFMQPFMSAFSSDIKGKASGEAHLYGTFSDIDMTGVIVAEEVDVMIDYINARYTGGDTVFMYPGRIEIPHMMVKDRFGHTAMLEGELKHRCFHDPVFNFRVTDMDRMLVYDTNSKINPLWYGMIFASGNGEITGRPGLVRIAADVETAPGSDFTFVLSDQQEAVKSNFLTFSDRRREAEEAIMPKDTVPDFLQKFIRRHNVEKEEQSDVFVMDFRVSVTDDVRFNLIMDPVAGDKIVAYGSGAMTLTYSSLSDELRLYGKYVLDKGTYNFSLQDIILKEFFIKPGSSIAFTGDPYTGILNITAAYRVNTSLTELDQSFANDRELNRTSVPVEALLKVTGVLTSPNIDFDIELPTVTEETAQKVRSIISTEDMMSKQVLYLVALNKFYPPEYMTTSNSGGEWASIASSTISSQIQNMIGQITDKFTLAPSIRSDKGDFSDIEVDLALSSQLFNNRLLINGNVGYRDPSNSSTTFVGDFDVEYLLNRKGTWRLKAYNHFNDQNYYLKSALTTQGLGIVWRKDFGLPRKGDEPEDKGSPEEVKDNE